VYEKSPRSIIGPLNIYSIMALAGMIGPLVIITVDLIAAISQAGYNPVSDSISSLALSPMGWLQTIGFLVVGLLVEVFVMGLFLSIRGERGFGFGIGLLICFGFGLLLIGAFRTDPVGSQHTLEGIIHLIVSEAVFIIFPIASLFIALSLRRDLYWKRILVYTIAASSFSLALVIGQLWLPGDSKWFGLYERILVANAVIWVEIVAIRLLRLTISAPERLKVSSLL